MLGPFPLDDLLLDAFRYNLGRSTGYAHTYAQRLATAWPTLSTWLQQMIGREVAEAAGRDERARRFEAADRLVQGPELPAPRWPLGTDEHREAWLQVLQLSRA